MVPTSTDYTGSVPGNNTRTRESTPHDSRATQICMDYMHRPLPHVDNDLNNNRFHWLKTEAGMSRSPQLHDSPEPTPQIPTCTEVGLLQEYEEEVMHDELQGSNHTKARDSLSASPDKRSSFSFFQAYKSLPPNQSDRNKFSLHLPSMEELMPPPFFQRGEIGKPPLQDAPPQRLLSLEDIHFKPPSKENRKENNPSVSDFVPEESLPDRLHRIIQSTMPKRDSGTSEARSQDLHSQKSGTVQVSDMGNGTPTSNIFIQQDLSYHGQGRSTVISDTFLEDSHSQKPGTVQMSDIGNGTPTSNLFIQQDLSYHGQRGSTVISDTFLQDSHSQVLGTVQVSDAGNGTPTSNLFIQQDLSYHGQGRSTVIPDTFLEDSHSQELGTVQLLDIGNGTSTSNLFIQQDLSYHGQGRSTVIPDTFSQDSHPQRVRAIQTPEIRTGTSISNTFMSQDLESQNPSIQIPENRTSIYGTFLSLNASNHGLTIVRMPETSTVEQPTVSPSTQTPAVEKKGRKRRLPRGRSASDPSGKSSVKRKNKDNPLPTRNEKRPRLRKSKKDQNFDLILNKSKKLDNLIVKIISQKFVEIKHISRKIDLELAFLDGHVAIFLSNSSFNNDTAQLTTQLFVECLPILTQKIRKIKLSIEKFRAKMEEAKELLTSYNEINTY